MSARVAKVKIGCVTGTSLLWYLKCFVGPTNPILMTFTFYVLNLKIELSHGKRIIECMITKLQDSQTFSDAVYRNVCREVSLKKATKKGSFLNGAFR